VLLDAPVETGMARARKRGELDRFEQETVEFFARIRAIYLQRARRDPQRYHIVDAGQPLARVSADVKRLFQNIVSL